MGIESKWESIVDDRRMSVQLSSESKHLSNIIIVIIWLYCSRCGLIGQIDVCVKSLDARFGFISFIFCMRCCLSLVVFVFYFATDWPTRLWGVLHESRHWLINLFPKSSVVFKWALLQITATNVLLLLFIPWIWRRLDVTLQGQGTVKSNAAFNAEQDCQSLRRAMKGLG